MNTRSALTGSIAATCSSELGVGESAVAASGIQVAPPSSLRQSRTSRSPLNPEPVAYTRIGFDGATAMDSTQSTFVPSVPVGENVAPLSVDRRITAGDAPEPSHNVPSLPSAVVDATSVPAAPGGVVHVQPSVDRRTPPSVVTVITPAAVSSYSGTHTSRTP